MASRRSLSSALSRGLRPAARFVEAEQHRIGTHGAGDFQPPLRAIGQDAGRIVGPLGQADAVEPAAALSRPARSAAV